MILDLIIFKFHFYNLYHYIITLIVKRIEL